MSFFKSLNQVVKSFGSSKMCDHLTQLEAKLLRIGKTLQINKGEAAAEKSWEKSRRLGNNPCISVGSSLRLSLKVMIVK